MAQQHGENLKQAMDTLGAHTLRSFLTVFGVVLGVSVIMLVAALITGFDQQVQESIKQYGADTAFVSRFEQGPHGGGGRPKDERERKPLTLEDGEAIKELSLAVKDIRVFITWWEQPHSVRTKDGEVSSIDYRGVQPNFGQVYANAATLAGRFISEGDDLHREKVVMLGENAAPVLFPNGSPVGKDVMIDGSAFLVIGVGVMNIMLVSVTERTREIGIRKAIGAKSGDITWQFLLEAMALTGVGGVLALLLVNGLVLLVRVSLKWPGSVPMWAALTGIVVSVSVGLVFGVWPAMKAAKLDPVEALRYQ